MKAFMQIKSQFEYEICTGRLAPGSRLPSVRQVAATLGVSPETVTRAYRELALTGLAASQPGVGFFVLSVAGGEAGSHAKVRDGASRLIGEAVADGVSLDQVLQIVLAEITEMRIKHTHLELIFLCKRDGRLEELAEGLRQLLADLRVDIVPVVLEDVLADFAGWLPRLQKASHVIGLVFDLSLVQPLLARHGLSVIPILAMPREDVRVQLAELEPGCRVGILASAPDFVDGMISGVVTANPHVQIVGALSCLDTQQVPALLASADCIVYGTLARHTLQSQSSLPPRAIELVYVPETNWVERIRARLRSELSG